MIISSKLRMIVPAVILVTSALVSSFVVWFANGVDFLQAERAETSTHHPRTFGQRKVKSTLPSPTSEGAFLTKPLFLAERDALHRPVEPVLVPEREDEEVSPPQVKFPEPLDLKVIGMITDNGKFLGLFLPPAGGEVVRLSVGDDYRGWTLESFSTDSAVFVSGARSEILHITE